MDLLKLTGIISGSRCSLDSQSMFFSDNVVAEVILPHFRVRPFCVVVSSSLWNPEVPGLNLRTVGTYSALGTSLVKRM